MSARKQEQQRLRLPPQAASHTIIYEDSSDGQPDPTTTRVRAPELDTCMEVVTEALSNPNRAMLRRVFFIAEDKSKYVSVGYYPARGYQPLAEFVGVKKLPLLLNAHQLQTVADNIAALCNALSTNEHFAKNCDFKMNTTGSYRVARVQLGKQYLSFTYEELRNLAHIMYMIQNQMTFYIAAMTDVMAYIDTAHTSATCGAFLQR
jgi:hypothetical protein